MQNNYSIKEQKGTVNLWKSKDAYKSFSDDALRILRAIRFATILDFKLSDEVVDAIKKTKDLVRNLSYYRKKSELDKIFTSSKSAQVIISIDGEIKVGYGHTLIDYSNAGLVTGESVLVEMNYIV